MLRAAVLIALALGTWAVPTASLQPDGQPDAVTRLTDRKPCKDHVEIKTELPGRFFRTDEDLTIERYELNVKLKFPK